jgi:transcriptional regulator with XRE-family HTH domain
MNIGQAIVTIRKARKMTQKQLAEKCGMSQNGLVALEKNRSRPPMETLKKLQKALDVPQSYIMLYAIEDIDIPEAKLETAKRLLLPLKEYLLKDI